MAKKITFTDAQKEEFKTLFETFHVNANAEKYEHRSSARILDALEAISIVEITADNKEGMPISGFPNEPWVPRVRVLNPGGGSIILEETDHAFLISALEKAKGLPVFSRKMARVWAVLDSAKAGDYKLLMEEESKIKEAPAS